MAMTENWNGAPVAVRRSRGGVLTFERWDDNVLGGPPWPNALLDQVRGYVARHAHFADADAEALAAHLEGRISKFQSVNSEDAVTYSWFGHSLALPLARAGQRFSGSMTSRHLRRRERADHRSMGTGPPSERPCERPRA
jgi:hypothetical protein